MSNQNEPVLNGQRDATRIAELEIELSRMQEEKVRLRLEREAEREALIAQMIEDLPKTEQEFLSHARDGQSFGELLVELGFKPTGNGQ